jgi:apolipoprotein D and lipocalin family protein
MTRSPFPRLGLAAALLIALAGCSTAPHDTRPPVQTVAQVDLQRYQGRWYEIASYPMYFQRKCIGDTTADYALRDDGRVGVLNRCRTESDFIQADGKASVVDGSANARLRVSFFWPFHGDYWIIGLDPDYRWAVVGDPDRRYLWVLSRTPSLDQTSLAAALAAAKAQAYDLAPLRYTTQSAATQR